MRIRQLRLFNDERRKLQVVQPGYLHRWIGSNFQRVWKKRKSPPRILGERRAYAVQQNSFLELGRMLVSRFAAMIQKEQTRPILFEILDMDDVGGLGRLA